MSTEIETYASFDDIAAWWKESGRRSERFSLELVVDYMAASHRSLRPDVLGLVADLPPEIHQRLIDDFTEGGRDSPTGRIPRLGRKPRIGQDKRANGRDLRWSPHVAAGLIHVTRQTVVVPPDGIGAIIVAFTRTFTGWLPTSVVATPYRLQLFVRAPHRLYDQEGTGDWMTQYALAGLWKETHRALEADVCRARTLAGGEELCAPGSFPDMTYEELSKTNSPHLVSAWIASAVAALNSSKIALVHLDTPRPSVALGGEILLEQGLPRPWVVYPSYLGAFLGYSASAEGPFVLCECSRLAVRNVGNDDDEYEILSRGRTGAMPDLIARDRDFIDIANDSNSWAVGVCHRCNGLTPAHRWSLYGARFRQYHGWFISQELLHQRRRLELLKTPPALKIALREVENSVRDDFDYNHVGAGLISENRLAVLVAQILEKSVERNIRPIWLEGLELDIWVPDLRLGIEYQGEQHFRPVDHWGGRDAFTAQIERDTRKVRLAAEAHVKLVVFDFGEPLTDAHVRTRLGEFAKPV